MGRRTNLRLAQPKSPPGQRFRGFDRQCQSLGLHRLRAAAHLGDCPAHRTTYAIKIRTLRLVEAARVGGGLFAHRGKPGLRAANEEFCDGFFGRLVSTAHHLPIGAFDDEEPGDRDRDGGD